MKTPPVADEDLREERSRVDDGNLELEATRSQSQELTEKLAEYQDKFTLARQDETLLEVDTRLAERTQQASAWKETCDALDAAKI